MQSETAVDSKVRVRELSDEDVTRADLYAVLARLLSQPPTASDLAMIGAVLGGAGEMGEALDGLAAAARSTNDVEAGVEFQGLFIGLGRGELLPYASYYLTGFLQEKPLAKLRKDLASIGAQPAEASSDPEDHAAAVLEVMAGLVRGAFPGAKEGADRRFFDDHIAPWMPVFFRDLEAAKSAGFYVSVGRVGRLFVAIESEAFAMAA